MVYGVCPICERDGNLYLKFKDQHICRNCYNKLIKADVIKSKTPKGFCHVCKELGTGREDKLQLLRYKSPFKDGEYICNACNKYLKANPNNVVKCCSSGKATYYFNAKLIKDGHWISNNALVELSKEFDDLLDHGKSFDDAIIELKHDFDKLNLPVNFNDFLLIFKEGYHAYKLNYI
jgi:hypothetical protein